MVPARAVVSHRQGRPEAVRAVALSKWPEPHQGRAGGTSEEAAENVERRQTEEGGDSTGGTSLAREQVGDSAVGFQAVSQGFLALGTQASVWLAALPFSQS